MVQTLPSAKPPPRQQGIALIMVLLIVAVVSIIATETSSRIQFEIQKAQNRQQYQQASWYAIGAERLARGLIEIAKNDPTINLDQDWANPYLSYPIDGGSMTIQILDQQNCFNLNALSSLNTPQASRPTVPLLERQLKQLLVELDADPHQILQLVEPLLDWVDNDTLPSGFEGVEDLHYNGLDPAYLPANGPLTDPSELKLINGFNPSDDAQIELLEQWSPYLCTLPTPDLKVNINTLAEEQAPLLAAILDGKHSSTDIETALQSRPDDGFANVGDFVTLLPVLTPPLSIKLFDHLNVTSEFFLARIQVRYYDANLILFSQFKIDPSNQPVTYRRRYGGPNE
ncbi:MAG: type II secretion system minor pseudopilin GspK [Halopseudomonas sp.]